MEIYRDIEGYEGLYRVSNKGNIKSLKREVRYSDGRIYKYPERNLKISKNTKGYYRVALSLDKKAKTKEIHRLVAKAFLKNDRLRPHVNHINAIKTDNNINNLEWCTHLENVRHAHRLGLVKKVSLIGATNGNSKLTNKEIKSIRLMGHLGYSRQKIAYIFSVTAECIGYIIRRQTWSHI